MQFTKAGQDPDGNIYGTAREEPGPARDLCERYSRISARISDPAQDRLVPVVVSDPWPFLDRGSPRRRLFCPDDLPHVASAVAAAGGRGAGQADVLVLLPAALAASHHNDAEIAMMAVVDLASWAADNGPAAEGLGWAADTVTRSAVASRILRGAEGAGIVGTREAADGYHFICSLAMGAITAGRQEENSEALVTLDTPGLVGVLDRAVRHARAMPVPALPLNLAAELREAVRAVGMALDVRAGEGRSRAA